MLAGLTTAGFALLGSDVSELVGSWVLPCGAMGAVFVAAWLVEAKQGVVENIAPVLTTVFTPPTTVMLLAFLAATLAAGGPVEVDRELLILFDLVLVLVLGLLLFAISARGPDAPPGGVRPAAAAPGGQRPGLDVLMLSAMLARIAEFGFSANKTAALGLNLVPLVNLSRAAWLGLGFLRRRVPLRALERWQTRYLPVYGAWAAVVVVASPRCSASPDPGGSRDGVRHPCARSSAAGVERKGPSADRWPSPDRSLPRWRCGGPDGQEGWGWRW